ncbi:MAG: GNAT family N-acetyltransferase [Bacteriovorax sp.]
MKLIVDNEITLRQISQEFASELFSLAQNNVNEKLFYWCPGIKKTYLTKESTIAHIIDANEKFNDDGTPDYLIFWNKKLAGIISLSPLNADKTKSEIGYWLGSEFEGKGLISRSFPLVLEYAKNTLHLKTVELSTAVTNVRSQKLPHKFGFKREQIIPNVEILEDGPVDHILWQLDL